MVASRSGRGVRIHVHQDALALDATLALVDLASGSRPLEETLCAMCRLVAQIARVDVVSVYLRERRARGEVLVLRGNGGFPAHAVGHVELELFDGLTGVVAERRRPVTVAIAQDDQRYKHVDGIGEERFPAYLGVPLMSGEDVVGVLVLQRVRPYRFLASDVSLASSLTAPFIFAIQRRPVAGPHVVGEPVVAGHAAGPAVVVPGDRATLPWALALQALELDLTAATQRLRHCRSPEIARSLANLTLVTHALREHAGDDDVLAALERVPFRMISGARALGTLLDERRVEVGELARFLRSDTHLTGGVLVVPHLGTFLALEAVARFAAAVVTEQPIAHDAAELLRAANVPAIAGVPGIATRVRGGERLEVDGGALVLTTRPCESEQGLRG